jgi:ABC-type Mn2+/Zn2+ transport system permease subunit
MDILTEEFILYALAASVMIGSLCAFLGIFVVLKRIVFLGVTLAEVSALGVAAGLIIGINPVISALALTVGAVILFWLPYRSSSISREGLIGFTYVFAAALAVILIAKNPMAESKGLDLISGNLLYVEPSDLAVTAILVISVAVLYMLMYRNFLYVSFDAETASASGLNAPLFDFLIYLSIGVAVGVTMKVAGILFVFGNLVVPPLAGMLLFRRMPHIIAASVLFSIVSSAAGIMLSIILDWPTAPSILVTGCSLMVLLVAGKMLLRSRFS